jgi:LytS/YehU family sensor histidine kinase
VDEVRLVDDYLGIERIRFGERLSYTLDLPTEVADIEVPSTILLTLAENAVKHGVEATAESGSVELVVRRSPDARLIIALTSPAPVAPHSRAPRGTGYGLSDVNERLELAYGGRATLTLRVAEGQARAELILPG